jgi:hypothetical protein
MDAELKEALRRMAEGRHPVHDWPIPANHSTLVSYVGITGRKGDRPRLIIDHISLAVFVS